MTRTILSDAEAATVMVPKYEVKLLLKPSKVLDLNHQLVAAVKELFSVNAAPKQMNVQYLDTDDKKIFHQDWSPRIRKMQGDADLELTYKKRYKITDSNIDRALIIAKADGFNLQNTVFEAQVDWGYVNQTLSVHRDEFHHSTEQDGLELPEKEAARKMLIEKAPDKFASEVGTSLLEQSRVYGPIMAERFAGTWDDDELDVEVWPIRDIEGTGIEYIVEVSFKVRKYSKAVKRRDQLMEKLEAKGWLLPKDSLRTVLIMERH